MLSVLNFFASGDSGIHVSLKAEKIFEIGGLSVTNSMLYGFLVALFMAVLLVFVARKSSVKAKNGVIAIIEMIVEFVVGLLESAFGSREKAYKYAPVFGTFFLFILFSNVLGLLPIVGPGLNSTTAEGTVPLLRPFTADLNGTIVMSVVAIIAVQVMSIQAQGFKGHLTHYFSDKPFNPINFFIGIFIYNRVVNIFGITDYIARRIYYSKSKYAQRLAE